MYIMGTNALGCFAWFICVLALTYWTFLHDLFICTSCCEMVAEVLKCLFVHPGRTQWEARVAGWC